MTGVQTCALPICPLEINVLDVSELLARCVPPSTNDLLSKSAIHIPAEMDGQQFQHSRSESSNVFVSEYCPAPSFDIFKYDFPTAHVDDGADRDVRENALADHESSRCQVTKEPVIEIIEDEKVGNLEGIDEGYAHAEEQAMKCEHESLQYQVPKEPLIEIIDDDHVVDLEGIVGNIYQTPEKVTHNQVVVGSGSNIYSSSSSGKMVPQQFERRIIKPPPCKRSPFLDYNERKVYICKPEVSRLYASVILHGRLNEEESPDVDTSPKVIDYNGYDVSVKELANSMKEEGYVLTHIMEIGILSIMMNLPADSKKVVMPLRFSTRMLQMTFLSNDIKSQEIISRFKKSNHLDRKDMIMFIVLENIDKSKKVPGNHYWVFNVNIRDRRFEVLDSWRTLQDKTLDVCARTMVASFRALWEEHYPKSHISLDDFTLRNIDVPKQTNKYDCGIFALSIANGWEGRNVPRFTAEDVQSIRKQLTNTWVNTKRNKAPWEAVLKLA